VSYVEGRVHYLPPPPTRTTSGMAEVTRMFSGRVAAGFSVALKPGKCVKRVLLLSKYSLMDCDRDLRVQSWPGHVYKASLFGARATGQFERM